MIESLSMRDNVVFLARNRCDWGGFGHVEASLKGLRALEDKGARFDYVILLTGQDYPIKSNSYIQEFLGAHWGYSYIDFFPLPHKQWPGNGGLDRLLHWHFILGGHHFECPIASPWRYHHLNLIWNRLITVIPAKRKWPEKVLPYGGSSYWCLSRECIEYILQYVQANEWWIRYFKHAWVPDELFFQTILLNSPYRDRLVNDNLRFIQWTNRQPSPDILTAKDFPSFSTTAKLFARKFDATIDASVLDMIDSQFLREASACNEESMCCSPGVKM